MTTCLEIHRLALCWVLYFLFYFYFFFILIPVELTHRVILVSGAEYSEWFNTSVPPSVLIMTSCWSLDDRTLLCGNISFSSRKVTCTVVYFWTASSLLFSLFSFQSSQYQILDLQDKSSNFSLFPSLTLCIVLFFYLKKKFLSLSSNPLNF